MNKERKLSFMSNKKVLLLFIFIIFIVMMAIFLSSFFSDYSRISLFKNKKEIFNVSDLSINDLTYMSTEKDVKKEFGKPKSIDKKNINGLKYQVYNYDGFKITLKEFYETYKISKVEVTSNKVTVSGNIKVGTRIIKVMNKFRVSNKKNRYIYNNYASSALEDETITDNIYYGKRTKTTVEYVNRDKILTNIDTPNNIAKLIINYKHGRVTKIVWSYDIQ